MANITYQIRNYKADTYQKMNVFLEEFCDNLISVNPSILTQTSDTGQFDWGSLSSLPAIGDVYGYNIFEFDDGLGSQSYFLKFEWFRGDNDFNQAYLTIGTGSNGSGTLTGIFFARQVVFQTTSATISDDNFETGVVNISILPGYLMINIWEGNKEPFFISQFLSLSRPVDDLGDVVDDRLIVYHGSGDEMYSGNQHVVRETFDTLTGEAYSIENVSDILRLPSGMYANPNDRNGNLRVVRSLADFSEILVDPNVVYAKSMAPRSKIMPTGPTGDVFIQISSLRGSGSESFVNIFARWE